MGPRISTNSSKLSLCFQIIIYEKEIALVVGSR